MPHKTRANDPKDVREEFKNFIKDRVRVIDRPISEDWYSCFPMVKNNILVDATYGRKTRAVIIADSGHIILSAVQPETVAGRLTGGKDDEIEENEIED